MLDIVRALEPCQHAAAGPDNGRAAADDDGEDEVGVGALDEGEGREWGEGRTKEGGGRRRGQELSEEQRWRLLAFMCDEACSSKVVRRSASLASLRLNLTSSVSIWPISRA